MHACWMDASIRELRAIAHIASVQERLQLATLAFDLLSRQYLRSDFAFLSQGLISSSGVSTCFLSTLALFLCSKCMVLRPHDHIFATTSCSSSSSRQRKLLFPPKLSLLRLCWMDASTGKGPHLRAYRFNALTIALRHLCFGLLSRQSLDLLTSQ